MKKFFLYLITISPHFSPAGHTRPTKAGFILAHLNILEWGTATAYPVVARLFWL